MTGIADNLEQPSAESELPDGGLTVEFDDDERGGANAEAELAGASTPELTPRQIQRREQKARRNLTRAKVDALEQRVAELDRMLQQSQGQLHTTQNAALAAEYRDLEAKAAGWKHAYERAIENGDGASATQAQEYWQRATQAANQVANEYNRQQQERRPSRGAPDPAILTNVKQFYEDNPWFDPKGGDAKSKALLSIGARLENMGISPGTDDYWEELALRAERKGITFTSPVDDEGSDDEPQQVQRQPAPAARGQSAPPVGGRGDASASAGTGKRGQFTFSPEHIKTLRDAGIDVVKDLAARAKWAKIYAAQQKGA